MKALTICQPYAHLIVVTKEKRVENRTWETNYRGPLLIHAGKSEQWLKSYWGVMPVEAMSFGAIIGVVDLIDCVAFKRARDEPAIVQRYPWLWTHEHSSGPYLWVLDNPRQFKTPIPYRGMQGLFNVPYDLIKESL